MAPLDGEENAVDLKAGTEKKPTKQDEKGAKGKKGEVEPDAMSEEDQELKDRLDTCVSTLLNSENEASVTVPIRLKALDVIVSELRSATSSMTSVPKPLKFLRPHFDVLKKYFATIVKADATDSEMLSLRARLADVLSVLAMTMGKHGKQPTLYSIFCCSLLLSDLLVTHSH
jgi:26S proteasome regulatory subunit N1